MKSIRKRVLTSVGILMLAVPLQGCLLLEKLIFDSYLAVHGIPDGVEQPIASVLLFRSYCTADTVDGTAEVIGQILQAGTFPSALVMFLRIVDPIDTVVREDVLAIAVNEDGSISTQTFPLPAGCIEAGNRLVFLVRPMGGDIEQGAKIDFGILFRFPGAA